MSNPVLFYGLNLAFYLFFQIFLLHYVQLFDFALCYIYVFFLILLPVDTPKANTLLIGFGLGLAVDYFYQTFGIHALACVFVGYLKPALKNSFEPLKDFQPDWICSIKNYGLGWFLRYYGTLILVHHLTIFLVEAAGPEFLIRAVIRALASVVFTLIIATILQYLFYYPKN
jgi:hypothetical protein